METRRKIREKMFEEFAILIKGLHLIASLGAIAAFVVAFRMYKETDKGWYWLSMLLSSFFLALSQILFILFPLGAADFRTIALVEEISTIVAVVLFAASCYGIYKTMKSIRKRIE